MISGFNANISYPGSFAPGAEVVQGTIFPSASRIVAVYTSGEIHNNQASGVRLFVNVTTNGGGTLVVKLQVKDPVSGSWGDLALATTASILTDIMSILTVAQGLTETANVDVATPVGPIWRVVATVTNATMVFSVGAQYVG